MKRNILNLGKVLNKIEQQNVNGGKLAPKEDEFCFFNVPVINVQGHVIGLTPCDSSIHQNCCPDNG